MFETTQGRVYCAIVNGTQLPKEHGRLIDESTITTVDYNIVEEEFKTEWSGKNG